jgi:hypothetical protein
MTATYNTVTIGSNEYDVYSDLPTAETYLNGESWATAWQAETSDDAKGRALVTATRTLDKLVWPGSKTEPAQALEWPRKGTGLSEDLVPDEFTIPQRIIDATAVLAALAIAGVDFINKSSTQSGAVKRQAAGSVSIEFFRDVFDLDGERLPLAAWELIAPLLGGAGMIGGAEGSGLRARTRYADSNRPLGGYATSEH